AVLIEHQAEEFAGIVRDQIDLQPIANAGRFDRLVAIVQADDFLEGKKMNAAQVVIAVGGGEAVQVRTADRGEEQRIGLRLQDGEDARVELHGLFNQYLQRSAFNPLPRYSGGGLGRGFARVASLDTTPSPALPRSTEGGRDHVASITDRR